VSNERSDEFYRIFSVLNFLLCMEHKGRVDEEDMIIQDNVNAMNDETAFNDPHVFGHGFAIGGVVFLHLFKQSCKFKILDLTYHLLKVEDAEKIRDIKNEVEGKTGGVVKEPVQEGVVKRFLDEARAQRDVHDYVWGILESCGRGERGQKKQEEELNATFTFAPPADDRKVSAIPSSMRKLLHRNSSNVSNK